MQDASRLKQILNRIDQKGYKAYKQIAGAYDFGDFQLFIDHVQGDPFAAPSRLRLRMDQSVAQIPETLFSNKIRRTAMEDYLIRCVYDAIGAHGGGVHGTGKSGVIRIDRGGQEVIERTAMALNESWVEARIYVGLPAAGRRISGKDAKHLLTGRLPKIADAGLKWPNLQQDGVRSFVECIENQEYIRMQLRDRKLVGFVADGAILPRKSGASDLPMTRKKALPFEAPPSMRVEMPLLNPIQKDGQTLEKISGLGVSEGVTLIVGGGYHGKSTLLKALERGVYPHIPGDGREYVVSNPNAVKIRSEDGRRVEKVDLSPFINNLPFAGTTHDFSSDDASGSTSQAANIMEFIEMGSELLLVDEDTSATNFMIRDARMQALVHKDDEPITPFMDRVYQLYQDFNINTILVMGGSGDYLDQAHTVVMMKNYKPYEVTEEARRVAGVYPNHRKKEASSTFAVPTARIPVPRSFDASRGKKKVKIDAKSLDTIVFGKTDLDIRYLEQLVDLSQAEAIGQAIHYAAEHIMVENRTFREVLDALEALFDEKGLAFLDPFYQKERHPGSFARPRRFEIGAAINRLRTLIIKQLY